MWKVTAYRYRTNSPMNTIAMRPDTISSPDMVSILPCSLCLNRSHTLLNELIPMPSRYSCKTLIGKLNTS